MNPKQSRLLAKAHALDRSGRGPEALAAYREFLTVLPRHDGAWADYSGQLIDLGFWEQAQAACEQALQINPDSLAAKVNMGSIFAHLERMDEAESLFQLVVQQDPSRTDARLGLAECLLKRGDLDQVQDTLAWLDQGEDWLGPFAGLKARCTEIWATLAGAWLKLKKLDAAEQACGVALHCDPDNCTANFNRGCILLARGAWKEAEGQLRRVLAEQPERTDVRLVLGDCLRRRGNLRGVEEELGKVIQQEPVNLSAHINLSGAYYALGRWADFQGEIERYRRLDPISAFPEFEQGFLDLLFGKMPTGWDHYEARLRIPGFVGEDRTLAQPLWRGEPFPGKTLLLTSEQGFGDTLMFIRYAPMVKALGGKVILEAHPSILDVVATCQGVDEVVLLGEPLGPFDLHVSLLSLPALFRTELASIPQNVPYLDVPQAVPSQQVIAQLMALAKDKLRIGLVWAGNPNHLRDLERSVPPGALAPLAALPGIAWFSLQMGQQDLPPLPNLVSLAPLLGTFSDTAYALSGMDLVISVDTAVAHLAGSLGIPALVLLSFQPDFRWLLDRDDSPWYPSLRLYRQPQFGDWDSVIQRLLADLGPDAQ